MRFRWIVSSVGRWVALAAVVSLVVVPGSASASRARGLTASVPQAVVTGARVVVTGTIHGVRVRSVALQRHGSRGWTVVTQARVRRGHRFRLSWRTPTSPGTVSIRVVGLRSGRQVALSPITRVHVTSGHFAPGKTTIVEQPARVAALPSPGQAGTVILSGVVNIKPGHVLALGYSPSTPDGFLGLVEAASVQGSQTVLQTRPATLEEAGAQGVLDLANFHEVLPSGAVDPAPIGRAARIAASEGVFNHDIGKGISCSDSASASLTGNVSVTVTPELKADFSIFSGLKSASFTLTGTAAASVKAAADASASCSLESTPLLAEPIHIATFVGDVGVVPVVVVLQGQVYVDASISGKAAVCSSISASASITGGIGYANGNFSPIWSGPNTSFSFKPPTAQLGGSAEANVKPALQMLLYGVGGPQLGVKAGLAFNADTSANPWWTLTAPFSVDAALVAPSLDLDSGDLTLYEHTFNITDAGGPIGDYPVPGCS